MTIYNNFAEIIGVLIAIYGIVILFILPRSQLVDSIHHVENKGRGDGHGHGHKGHKVHKRHKGHAPAPAPAPAPPPT